MSKERFLTLGDCMGEIKEITKDAAAIAASFLITQAITAFCAVVHTPYTRVVERLERRHRPLRLTNVK